MTYDDFMELDQVMLGACSAGFRFPGESPGADEESRVLRSNGCPVWTKLSEVPDLVSNEFIPASL
jgi:hypothetical protein